MVCEEPPGLLIPSVQSSGVIPVRPMKGRPRWVLFGSGSLVTDEMSVSMMIFCLWDVVIKNWKGP